MIPMKKMMAREWGSSEAGELLIVGWLSDWWQGTSLRGGERDELASRSGSMVGQPDILGVTHRKDPATGDSAGNEPQPAPE